MTTSAQVRRSRREQMELQRLAEARKERRNRIVFVGLGVLVLIIVIAIFVYGYVSASKSGGSETPPNANSGQNGILLAPATKGVPVLDVFTDYNCPHCMSADLTLNAVLKQAADQGYATVVMHTMSFEASSSRPAAIAASCADFVGKFFEYNNQLFRNQSQNGYDTRMLTVTVPDAAGIYREDLTTFQTCVDKQSTAKFVDNMQTYASKQKVTTTPTFLLDGKDVTMQLYNNTSGTYDPDLLRQVLKMTGQ